MVLLLVSPVDSDVNLLKRYHARCIVTHKCTLMILRHARYIVTQQRRAVVAEDPCKLMAYFEELLGTDTLAKKIAEITRQLSECSAEICDFETRHER